MARVTFGVWDEKAEKLLWTPTSKPVRAQYLVTIDLVRSGETAGDMEGRYVDFFKSLRGRATYEQSISPCSWLFDLPMSLPEIFTHAINTLGADRFAFTLMDIGAREGLAYDCKRRIIFEIDANESLA